jgi:hypothetical protein
VCPAAPVSGATPVKVYTDVAGMEGASSCLFFVPTAVNYDTAKATCVSVGYHLLTTAARVKTPQTLMFYARDALVGNAALSWWMGGERTGNVATAGWSWVDGTSAENLNCGGAGCGGVWAAVQDGYRAQPDNFRGVEDRLHYWSGGAGNDLHRWYGMGFVCEREFVCPAGSFCSLNSDSIGVCPAGTFSAAGATSCTACAGNTISGGGADRCRTCPDGTEADPSHTTCGPARIPPQGKVCPTVSVPGASAMKVYSDVAGLEGASSCLFFVPTAVNYDTAKATCASVGYQWHLLTTAARLKTTDSSIQTLMFYARDALVGNAALSWWMGGERTGPAATAGWSWVDGTAADNLNCGGTGCSGVWSVAQPDNYRGVEDRLHYWPPGSAGNDLDASSLMGFVCEREFVCPAGSFCPLNSDSIGVCPAGTFSAAGSTACTTCVGNTVTVPSSSGVGASSCRLCEAGTQADPTHATCVPM